MSKNQDEITLKVMENLTLGTYTRAKLCNELDMSMPTLKKRLKLRNWGKLEKLKIIELFF